MTATRRAEQTASEPTGGPILEVSSVTVAFGGVTACADVSFEVKRGELFALIGPNGAGKTTLVNAITGIYAPLPGGAVNFNDKSGRSHDLLSRRPYQIARLGVARTFQNLGLFAEQSVLDNLMLGRYQHHKRRFGNGMLGAGLFMPGAVRHELEAREAVEQVIELLEISEYRWDLVGSLPYGVQKRIELGRVLAMEPELLLLDEPMAGMAVEEKQDMVRVLFDIRVELGTTFLLIEHDMGVVMAIADRVMVLDFGRRIGLGAPEDIKRDDAVIAAYLGSE